MNYLQQILAFDDYKMYRQRLSAGQVSLWHALMSINNKTGWASWFTAASKTLEISSGLSRSGVLKTRNTLKQLGLIDFETHGTNATSYHICVLYTSDSTQVSVQPSTQDGAQDGVQGSTQVEEDPAPEPEEPKPQKPKKPKKQEPKYSEDSQEFKAAKYLFSKIKSNNDNAKEPNYQSWANDFHLMFDVDKRSKRNVMKLIDWTQKDPFWCSNILSPKKLRQQFDRLMLQAKMTDTTDTTSSGEKRWTNAQVN